MADHALARSADIGPAIEQRLSDITYIVVDQEEWIDGGGTAHFIRNYLSPVITEASHELPIILTWDEYRSTWGVGIQDYDARRHG